MPAQARPSRDEEAFHEGISVGADGPFRPQPARLMLRLGLVERFGFDAGELGLGIGGVPLAAAGPRARCPRRAGASTSISSRELGVRREHVDRVSVPLAVASSSRA